MRKNLSPLQQQFYDLVVAFIENDAATMARIENEQDYSSYLEGLRRDISSMNAAELRQNIKVWKDD